MEPLDLPTSISASADVYILRIGTRRNVDCLNRSTIYHHIIHLNNDKPQMSVSLGKRFEVLCGSLLLFTELKVIVSVRNEVSKANLCTGMTNVYLHMELYFVFSELFVIQI